MSRTGSPAIHSGLWSRKCALLLLAALTVLGSVSGLAAGKETTLKLMHCWDAHRTAWVQEMIDDFEAAHPGIRVEAQLKSCGTLNDSFVTAYAGGTPPDVVMIHSLDISGTVSKGALLPIDSYLQKEGISKDTWYPSELGTALWQGQLYGLPIRTGGDTNTLLYYNKKTFAEAGLNPATPPATWDEWISMAKKLTRYDDGKLVQAGTSLYGGDFTEVGYLYSGGAKLFSDDGKTVQFTDEAGEAAAQFTYDLGTRVYRGSWTEAGAFLNNFSNQEASLASGRLAMHPGSILSYSYYQTNAPDTELGIAVRPSRVAGGPAGANTGTFHWALVKGTANPDAAWQLLEWISLRENTGGLFMLRQGRPSPVRAFNRNRAYFDANPNWLVVGEALARAAAVPQFPFTRDVINVFTGALGDVAWGGKSARAALTTAGQQAQAIIDEYWKKK